MRVRRAERKASPLFEIAGVLVRFSQVASLHRKRESRIFSVRLHSKKISVFASVETRVGEAKIPYEKIVLWSCDVVSRTGDG